MTEKGKEIQVAESRMRMHQYTAMQRLQGQKGKRETKGIPGKLKFPMEKALQPNSLKLLMPFLSLS